MKHNNGPLNFYDSLVESIFEIINNASSVQTPQHQSRHVQYGIIWSNIFVDRNGESEQIGWKIVLHKLKYKLMQSMLELESIPNKGAAENLSFLLNVMGLQRRNKERYNQGYHAFHKFILKWVKDNYLNLTQDHPHIAESCLTSSISFDKEKNRLVETYQNHMNFKPKQYFMDLTPLTE